MLRGYVDTSMRGYAVLLIDERRERAKGGRRGSGCKACMYIMYCHTSYMQKNTE
jgi:hypothetical protein